MTFLLRSILILCFSIIPLQALAIPTITCHCFTDRAYDPTRPAAADPYLLATSQNSFFAAAFGVDKKTIVMKKQKGLSGDDLWIAYWLAARSGRDPEALLAEQKEKGAWRQVAAPLAIPANSLGGRVAEALKTAAPDERIASAIVDEMLVRFRFHTEQDVASLRKAGAGNQELVLLGLISTMTRRPSAQLYLEVNKGGATWGALLQRADIRSSDVDARIKALVKGATSR